MHASSRLQQLFRHAALTTWWPLLILCTAAAALYIPFLGNPVVFDDENFFNGQLHPEFLSSIFSLDLRWYPIASLEWVRHLLGPNLAWQRIVNLMLHMANS